MKLDAIDLNILEAAVSDEPLHILCAMLEKQFKNIKEIVPRIIELEKNGLIEIQRDPGTNINPTPEDLERISINHKAYGNNSWPEGPTWSINTTEKGYEFIKDKFKQYL
jgi:hypothetical protein